VQNDAIDATSHANPTGPLPVTDATTTTGALFFNDEQFKLLSALASARVEGPIEASDIPANRELALQLGWSVSKFTRKLDNLCTKLTRAGVTGLQGSVTNVATDRRVQLANYVVEQGIVTAADVAALDLSGD